MRNPEGESDRSPLRPCFDRRLKLEFHGSRVTSDAGLLAYRELDDALGLTVLASDVLADSRTGKNGWHGVVGLLRQSVFGRLAGYEDVNDADRLGRDPAMRWVVGGKAVERGGASTSQMGRLETELLTIDDNLAALTALPGVWIDRVHARNRLKIIVLDMDSSVSPTHGEQEGTPTTAISAAPAIIRCSCSTSSAIWSAARFAASTAHEWPTCSSRLSVINRLLRRYFRGDAAFARRVPRFRYAIRLPANRVLQDSIGHLLKRPVGRPPKDVRRYYASFSYRAATWTKPRRVVAKVNPGELYPRSRSSRWPSARPTTSPSRCAATNSEGPWSARRSSATGATSRSRRGRHPP